MKKNRKVTYAFVKSLIEDNNIDLFAISAKRLRNMTGYSGKGAYQKQLKALRFAQRNDATIANGSPYKPVSPGLKPVPPNGLRFMPAAPNEIPAKVWVIAYEAASAQVARQLSRVTAERDSLRAMNASQAAIVKLYAEETSILQGLVFQAPTMLKG